MALHSRKKARPGNRSARRPSVNEVLRAAYERFTRDEYTRRALNIFIPRPTSECADTAAAPGKPADKLAEAQTFSRPHLAPLPA